MLIFYIMMNRVKFFRVKTLPAQGQPGGIYFVNDGITPKVYICISESEFELYSIEDYLESEDYSGSEAAIVEDTIVAADSTSVQIKYNTLRIDQQHAELDLPN
jgi:hypothetical protein